MSVKLVFEWQYTPIVNDNSPRIVTFAFAFVFIENADGKLFFHCMCEREPKTHPTSRHGMAMFGWHSMCYGLWYFHFISLALLKYFNLIKNVWFSRYSKHNNRVNIWTFHFYTIFFYISNNIDIHTIVILSHRIASHRMGCHRFKCMELLFVFRSLILYAFFHDFCFSRVSVSLSYAIPHFHFNCFVILERSV